MDTAIQVSGEIVLRYDEASPEFQQALEGYRYTMDPRSSATNMLRHVAFYITRFGADGMVEGVGYLKLGDNAPQDPYSGIEVLEGYDEFFFE